MDTTIGFRRNQSAELQAWMLGKLADMQQGQQGVLMATEAALANPAKLTYLVSVSSNLAENARGHELERTLTNAIRKYSKNCDGKLPPEKHFEVRVRFPGDIEFRLPRKLWRPIAEKALKNQRR